MSQLADVAAPAALAFLLLVIWEIACRTLAVPAYFLPPPTAVARAFIDHGPVLAVSAWNTLWMALQALALASGVAALLLRRTAFTPFGVARGHRTRPPHVARVHRPPGRRAPPGAPSCRRRGPAPHRAVSLGR